MADGDLEDLQRKIEGELQAGAAERERYLSELAETAAASQASAPRAMTTEGESDDHESSYMGFAYDDVPYGKAPDG
jgi:hypothetical protein